GGAAPQRDRLADGEVPGAVRPRHAGRGVVRRGHDAEGPEAGPRARARDRRGPAGHRPHQPAPDGRPGPRPRRARPRPRVRRPGGGERAAPARAARGLTRGGRAVARPTDGTTGGGGEGGEHFAGRRGDRRARVPAERGRWELGALLCFDMYNIRYITNTTIGEWAGDKLSRFALLPRGAEPIMWDFGSAARHHQLYCPWLGERSRAGIALLRRAVTPEMGRAEDLARQIKPQLEARGPH